MLPIQDVQYIWQQQKRRKKTYLISCTGTEKNLCQFTKNFSIFNPKLQCCGTGMFIPDPDFYPSRIPDLGSRIQNSNKREGWKKFVVITLKKLLISLFCRPNSSVRYGPEITCIPVVVRSIPNFGINHCTHIHNTTCPEIFPTVLPQTQLNSTKLFIWHLFALGYLHKDSGTAIRTETGSLFTERNRIRNYVGISVELVKRFVRYKNRGRDVRFKCFKLCTVATQHKRVVILRPSTLVTHLTENYIFDIQACPFIPPPLFL